MTEQTQPLALATAQQVVYGLVEAYFAAKLGIPLFKRSETIWLSSSSSSAVILLYSQRGQRFGSIADPPAAEQEHRPSLPLLSQIYPL